MAFPLPPNTAVAVLGSTRMPSWQQPTWLGERDRVRVTPYVACPDPVAAQPTSPGPGEVNPGADRRLLSFGILNERLVLSVGRAHVLLRLENHLVPDGAINVDDGHRVPGRLAPLHTILQDGPVPCRARRARLSRVRVESRAAPDDPGA
ncbi:hypothetical protein CHELA20_51768 [Hyphomicrobiales bacterium]|nr:hypothetical protein CHELA41_23245 [Hyphomicrobiales bacterium]CAH1678366.1 hypothetical protein CHELA20_51768 [Hyphomicrobiales bacterium]